MVMKKAIRILGAAAVAAAVGLLMGVGVTAAGAGVDASGNEVALGQELAAQVGVEPVSLPVRGCDNFFLLPEGGAGYCLDGVVKSDAEFFELGNRLVGYDPTDEEVAAYVDRATPPASQAEAEREAAAYVSYSENLKTATDSATPAP